MVFLVRVLPGWHGLEAYGEVSSLHTVVSDFLTEPR